jgi:hypothetical protein
MPIRTGCSLSSTSRGGSERCGHGEVVELDGGTLVLDGEESPSVVLRLTPWRARSVARLLQEWSSVSRIFQHSTRVGRTPTS